VLRLQVETAVYPELATVDPDKTIVHTTQVRLEAGGLSPMHREIVLGRKSYTLTEYALRNSAVWEAPTINIGMPSASVSLTSERASASLLGINGEQISDESDDPVTLNADALGTLATELDVGKKYTEMLQRKLSHISGSEEQRTTERLWIDATRDRLRAERLETALDPAARNTFTWQSRDNPGGFRGFEYIDAVIDHPDPLQRPTVDGHKVVANRLTLGATTANGSGGQVVDGVMVIGARDARSSPAIVLYTPDAPDSISFRELSGMDELQGLVRNHNWQNYFKARMSTADTAESTRILTGRGSTPGSMHLDPIKGDLYSEMYSSDVGFKVAHAQHRSTTSEQVSNLSLLNKSLFAYDVASTIVPPLRAGKLASTARKTLASLVQRALQRPAKASGASALSGKTGGARLQGQTTEAPPPWSMDNPAVIDRLQPGNRAAGGIQYQRDPVTGKEYLKVDGRYYRGEYRGGQNRIFNDRNISQTRVVQPGLDGPSIQPRETGLLGGNKFWRTFSSKRSPEEAERIALAKSTRLRLPGNTGIRDVRGKEINQTEVYQGYVFRGDMRDPAEIFRDGFRLRTGGNDFKQVSGHRGGFGGGHDALDPDGHGISTSAFYNKDNAGAFYYGGAKGGNTYLIDARRMTGFDLYTNNDLARNPGSKIKLKPFEINYAQDIPGEQIVGAFNSKGAFTPNPSYRPSKKPIPLPPEARIPG